MKRFVSIMCGTMMMSSAVSQVQLDVNPEVKYQVIEGFGASDAWNTEVVGATFSESTKEQAAKWLFSTSISNTGVCEGMGLSIWRFCVGPYSGLPSGSPFPPSDFFISMGTYDWSVNPGKQFFLDKALSYGCDQIGLVSGCIHYQLRADASLEQSFRNYAIFLGDVISHYNDLGYEFKYVSPVNEPQYDWTNGEMKWTSANISAMTAALCQELLDRNLDTPVLLGEAADWSNLYDNVDIDSHWARNQLFNYFDPLSSLYIGDYPNLMKEFSAHSYWTDQTALWLEDYRTKAKSKADNYGLKLHQTEWSMLSGAPIEGIPDDPSEMDMAMMLARVVYSDMVFAGVSSWTYWEAFGIGDVPRFNLISLNAVDKSLKVSKNLWALGNYSLFVRPGYERIEMTGAEDLNGLMGTAYLSPDKDKLVIVMVNMDSTANVNPVINLSEGMEIKEVKRYVTSSMFDLREIPIKDPQSIPVLARSVTSIVYSLGSESGIDENSRSEVPLYTYLHNTISFRADAHVERAILCDLSGRVVGVYDTPRDIDLNHMEKGLYCLQLNCEGRTVVERFWVK